MFDPAPRRWRSVIALAAAFVLALAAPFVTLYRLGRSLMAKLWPAPPESRPVLSLQASTDYLRRQLRREPMHSFQRYRMFPSV